MGIDRDDRWWFNAARSLRRPRRVPDWQPANYLNYILKGVEKRSGGAKRNKRPDKTVSGSVNKPQPLVVLIALRHRQIAGTS